VRPETAGITPRNVTLIIGTMSILTIVTFPDPILSVKAREVDDVDGELKKLMEDMLETMYYAPGVGLAGPQVGVDKRIIVIDAGGEEKREPILMANPQILAREGELVYEEGCLSLPEFHDKINRNEKVRVRGINEQGKEAVYDAEGLLAVVFQHEIDHLDGILLINKVSSLKRSIYKRKVRKGLIGKEDSDDER
jgi:peptide deformylase